MSRSALRISDIAKPWRLRMKAVGYLMDATLEDGILTFEGRGRAGGFALDWDLSDRMSEIDGTGWSAETRAKVKAALADKSVPCVPVGLIDRAEFKDANPLVNGSITIHVGDKKASSTSGGRPATRRVPCTRSCSGRWTPAS
jgi:hypothetical protein